MTTSLCLSSPFLFFFFKTSMLLLHECSSEIVHDYILKFLKFAQIENLKKQTVSKWI